MDISQQLDAIRDRAGFCDLSGRTQIEIIGADRTTVLHGLCTNDIRRLVPGTGCEAFLTDVQGKTTAYVYVFCLDESLVLDTAAGYAKEIIAGIDRYVIREDVKLIDRSQQWAEVLLSGAQAIAMLASSWGSAPPDDPLGVASGQIESIDVEIRRVAFANPTCFFLRCDANQLGELCRALQAAGAVECSQEIVEAARIEMGTPIFGQDITSDNLPQEVDRNEQAISFTKGCYLGQETVARIDAMGHVNRKLRAIKFAGDRLPPTGSHLEIDGKPVAKITSSCLSPRLGCPLALGYIRREHNQPGTKFATEFGDAEVMALPIV